MRYGFRLMTFATGLFGRGRRSRSAVLILALITVRASFAQEDRQADAPAPDRVHIVAPELAKVRLNHVSATWEAVLTQLAEDSGSTLVLHDVPPGRYTRQDWRRHTRSEAVRILNQQLGPLGYRILAKDRFLTVIQVQRTRTEYPRHEVARPAPQPEPASPAPSGGISTPVVDLNGTQEFRPLRNQSWIDHEAGDRRIIQVAGEQPASEEPAPAEAQPVAMILTQRLHTHRRAGEVADQLYEAFKDRAEVLDRGPTGLPALQAYREAPVGEHPTDGAGTAADRPVWFTVEVDGTENALLVHAAADAARGLVSLIGKLDVPPSRANETVRLVTDAGDDVEALAANLNGQLREIRQGRGQSLLAQQTDNALPGGALLQGRDQSDQPDTTVPVPNTELQQQLLIGNLRGDVTVEALPDLDLLILRGNAEDVESVMAVIRTIEAMAEGTTPQIDVHFLSYVDSEALAELLTNVYDSLTEVSSAAAASRQVRAVNVIAVGNPNAIVILAPKNVVPSVIQVVDKLDQPVLPGAEVQVFHLRNAIASQVVTMITGFYADRPGLGTDVRVVADARTNAVIVNARPNELAEVRRLIRQIDRDSTPGAMKMLPVHLEHALADELADFLTTMVLSILNPAQAPTGQAGFGAAGQGAQELRDTRAVVLEYLSTDKDAQRLVRSGLLSDVRFNADLRTNTLLITAPEVSLKFFEELVQLLDQPTTTVADIKVFPLKKADASNAAELLQSLFPEPQAGELGVQVAGTDQAGSGLIPLRVDVDLRSNSVIAIGSQEVLDVVGAILFRLDSADQLNRSTQVVRLHNNPALDISNAINQFLQSQRDLLQLDPDRISSSELLEQEIIVTPELVTNSLIISATPRYLDTVLELATQLDREPDQVMIQALIVEVTLEDTDEFGVELGFQDSLLFDRSVILQDQITTLSQTMQNASGISTTSQQLISQSGTPGFAFNNNPLGNNTFVNPGRVGTQGLSNFGLGRTNSDLGFGGLVLSASSEAVSVLIRALQSRRHVEVLSNPHVLALNNVLAQIQVGQRVPIVTGFNPPTATTAATPLVTYDDAGVILTVTPRISPDGQVVMEVAAEKSQYTSSGVPLFTDVNTGAVVESPIKDITTALSTVKVPDGQTIVMGGMIARSRETVDRKVPWLGDVPIIGNVFGYNLHNQKRTELLIFLTPRVIHNDADSELIKQVEMGRMHFFEDDAEMIHGPLMGIPAPQSAPPATDEQQQHGQDNSRDMNVEPRPLLPLPEPAEAPAGPMSSLTPSDHPDVLQFNQ
jgi:general secretion pathway protein D